MSTAPPQKPQSDAAKLRAARREIRALKAVIEAKDAELLRLGSYHQDVERSLHSTMRAKADLIQTGNGAVNFLANHAPFLPEADREDAEHWAAAWAAEVGPR
jgi:hypothetical protein